MSETPKTAPAAGTRRWLRILLVGSLMLNLVVIGLVAGAALNHDRDFRRDTALGDIGFSPFIAALPREMRREMGAELVSRAGSLRENRQSLEQQFREMLEVLRSEPFDADRLRAIISQQDSKLRERQDVGKAVLFAQLGRMSDAERRAYAEALEEGFRRGPKMWQRGGREPRRPAEPQH